MDRIDHGDLAVAVGGVLMGVVASAAILLGRDYYDLDREVDPRYIWGLVVYFPPVLMLCRYAVVRRQNDSVIVRAAMVAAILIGWAVAAQLVGAAVLASETFNLDTGGAGCLLLFALIGLFALFVAGPAVFVLAWLRE